MSRICLNPFVQVFYSNAIVFNRNVVNVPRVLIPLFRSFILILVQIFVFVLGTGIVLIPLFRSFILILVHGKRIPAYIGVLIPLFRSFILIYTSQERKLF